MNKLSGIIRQLKNNQLIESVLQFGSSLERKDYRDIDLCLLTRRKLSFQEKLALVRPFPERYDITFYDDFPLDLKKEILSQGKILFTRNYYQLLKELQYVDLEYFPYKLFLEEYHTARMASVS